MSNARSYVGQPCHPTDNLRSVVYSVDTCSMARDDWHPMLLSSSPRLLLVRLHLPSPSLVMHYGRLTLLSLFPSYLLSSQATPCILGRKPRTTTIIQSRAISTRSRIAVNTMGIKRLSLATPLACGRPFVPNREQVPIYSHSFSPFLARILVLLTLSICGGDVVIPCSLVKRMIMH